MSFTCDVMWKKVKSFCSACTESHVLRAFHGGMIVFWVLLWVVASLLGWVHNVAFVSHMSMAALVLGSFAAWGSARVEVKQEREEEK